MEPSNMKDLIEVCNQLELHKFMTTTTQRAAINTMVAQLNEKINTINDELKVTINYDNKGINISHQDYTYFRCKVGHFIHMDYTLPYYAKTDQTLAKQLYQSVSIAMDLIHADLDTELIKKITDDTEELRKIKNKLLDKYVYEFFHDTFLPKAFSDDGYTPHTGNTTNWSYRTKYFKPESIKLTNLSKTGLSATIDYGNGIVLNKYPLQTIFTANWWWLQNEILLINGLSNNDY